MIDAMYNDIQDDYKGVNSTDGKSMAYNSMQFSVGRFPLGVGVGVGVGVGTGSWCCYLCLCVCNCQS